MVNQLFIEGDSNNVIVCKIKDDEIYFEDVIHEKYTKVKTIASNN